MTADEWAAAYVLQFGAEQIHTGCFAPHEEAFFQHMAADLGLSSMVYAVRRTRNIIEDHTQRGNKP